MYFSYAFCIYFPPLVLNQSAFCYAVGLSLNSALLQYSSFSSTFFFFPCHCSASLKVGREFISEFIASKFLDIFFFFSFSHKISQLLLFTSCFPVWLLLINGSNWVFSYILPANLFCLQGLFPFPDSRLLEIDSVLYISKKERKRGKRIGVFILFLLSEVNGAQS